MRWLQMPLAALALAACGSEDHSSPTLSQAAPHGSQEARLGQTQTLKIYTRDGYRIVDIEAAVITWGGTAGGPPQRVRLVLVPQGVTPPELSGDLAGATLIRTPVTRIAVNDQSHEGILRALGVADRLVAVGGHTSYNDAIRARVKSGEIQQIGYGWHQPPTLDALVASRPDVLIGRMADLTHTQHMERVRKLGIPFVPTFIDAEPNYMGRLDWVRLVGMLVGREAEAEALVAEVNSEVARLKALAQSQPKRSLLWAWYLSAGDRWSVTQRNGDAALIRDANAELVMGAADDPKLDVFSQMSTEKLLEGATDADCWMIRDPLSSPFGNQDVLKRFRAYREDCVFWQPGNRNASADAWELWEMGMVRPDWLLGDIVKIVHPSLRDGQWRYFAPETWEVSNAGAGHSH